MGKGIFVIGGLLTATVLIIAITRETKVKPEQYICPYCGLIFSSHGELEAHCLEQHGAEPPPRPRDKFYMDSAPIGVEIWDGNILGMYWRVRFSKVIRNIGDGTGTHLTTWEETFGGGYEPRSGSKLLRLEPEERYVWMIENYYDFRKLSFVKVTLKGDWEKDNYAEGMAP